MLSTGGSWRRLSEPFGSLSGVGAARQLLEHVGHDAAGGEVGRFDGSVDSDQNRHRFAPAIGALDVQGRLRARAQASLHREIEPLRAVEAEGASTDAFLELARKDAHADQV